MIKKNGFYALIFFYNIQKRNAFYGKKSFKMLQHPYSFCELNFIILNFLFVINNGRSKRERFLFRVSFIQLPTDSPKLPTGTFVVHHNTVFSSSFLFPLPSYPHLFCVIFVTSMIFFLY